MTEGLPPTGPIRSRRTFSESTGKRDVDAAERAQKLRLLAFSPVGAVLGLVFGIRAGIDGIGGGIFILLSVLVGWALFYYGPQFAMQLGGRAASSIYNPRGSHLPPRKGYSQAESLVARGLYSEAIDAFELAVGEEPTLPEPYLHVARIYRDHLEQFEDAARWFKRARRDAEMNDGLKLLVTRELVELYVTRMGEAKRALPELARLREEQEGTPEGDWAEAELRRLKHGEGAADGSEGDAHGGAV